MSGLSNTFFEEIAMNRCAQDCGTTVDFLLHAPGEDGGHALDRAKGDSVRAYRDACRASADIVKRLYTLRGRAVSGEEFSVTVCEGMRDIKKAFNIASVGSPCQAPPRAWRRPA